MKRASGRAESSSAKKAKTVSSRKDHVSNSPIAAKAKKDTASSSSTTKGGSSSKAASKTSTTKLLNAADRKRALEYVEHDMECLTDKNGNIEYSEHMDMLVKLVKDPSLDAAQEVLKRFEPTEKKKSPTEKELHKMADDCNNGMYPRTGRLAARDRFGLHVDDIEGAICEQMGLARTHYSGVDGFRIYARLLPYFLNCGGAIYSGYESSLFVESVQQKLGEMEKLFKPDCNKGRGNSLKRARVDIEEARKKCEDKHAACGLLEPVGKEHIWDRLLAMTGK